MSTLKIKVDTKKEPGSNAPPLANRNQIHPGTGMMSQQPGTSIAESLDMWQTMNQAPLSRQQQELLQGSPKVPSALPGGPSGATIPQMPGPLIGNSNPMPGSVGTNGLGGPTGTLRTDMYSNTQPQQPQQPQQLTLQNPMLYQQHQLLMVQKLQQQQQQHQHQQLQSLSLQGKMHMSTTPMGGMQQNQMNSDRQQPVGQGGSFQQLTLMSQQQRQPQAAMQNPSIPTQQINNVTGLQQQQLQMQQNQQQSQMPQNQILNQHVMLGQQQGQMMGSGGGNMNFMQMQIQKRLQLLQQQQQQQQWQPPRCQLPLQQQLLAQQQQQRMMQQMEMQQQPMHRSSAPVQAQNGIAIDPQRQQQQQLIPQEQQSQRQQRGIADGAYGSATTQTRNPGDWQEEIHQKLTYLKDTYLADLQEIHQKLSTKLSQLDNVVLANARGGDLVEKMKQFKLVLERMMEVLQLSKQGVTIGLKEKLALYEKQILSILQNHKKVPQQVPPPRQSQPRKCKVCIDCVHKRRNS